MPGGPFTLCQDTGQLAVAGACPVHHVDACLRQFVQALAPASVQPLISFLHSRFTGTTCLVDPDFVPALQKVAAHAQEAGVRVWVTSSFRHPETALAGAIVTPAKRSNHLVGHAIDMNPVLSSGTVIQSWRMKRWLLGTDTLPAEAEKFLDLVRNDPALRWGGIFSTPDVVHIDDALNLRDPTAWQEKFSARRT